MESATPGIKSTPDGWLNRYLHAREHQSATPFRAVALAPQLPRALQGIEPALAIGQIGQFGIRAGQATDMVQASFEQDANAVMILGGGVRGGKVYGRWPGLAPEQRFQGRDLAVTTDFRSVFSEVVRGHLGLTDTGHVFPGFTDRTQLGFMKG